MEHNNYSGKFFIFNWPHDTHWADKLNDQHCENIFEDMLVASDETDLELAKQMLTDIGIKC